MNWRMIRLEDLRSVCPFLDRRMFSVHVSYSPTLFPHLYQTLPIDDSEILYRIAMVRISCR